MGKFEDQSRSSECIQAAATDDAVDKIIEQIREAAKQHLEISQFQDWLERLEKEDGIEADAFVSEVSDQVRSFCVMKAGAAVVNAANALTFIQEKLRETVIYHVEHPEQGEGMSIKRLKEQEGYAHDYLVVCQRRLDGLVEERMLEYLINAGVGGTDD